MPCPFLRYPPSGRLMSRPNIANRTCVLQGIFSMAVAILTASGNSQAIAIAQVPAADSVIVETLRDKPLTASDSDLRRLRARLRDSPADLTLATAVAQRAIEISRRDGDPRYLGYAQAALAPWWSQSNPPGSVRLLKAVLFQSTHHFGPALAELDAVLRAAPGNAQAWLIRASILQVQGDYSNAANACERLRSAAAGAGFYADVCIAELGGLTGDAPAARVQLAGLVSTGAGRKLPVGWLAVIQAEMAERAGDLVPAEKHFRAALAESADAYTKAAFADFLLDQQRGREVITLLSSDQRADALLLRLALAYQAEKDARLATAIVSLKSRFDAARLRGDSVHQREEARFTLQLLNQPAQALALAQQNWAVQKEPADARILLGAAQAAGRNSAADPVREFIRNNRINDQRLAVYLK